MFSIFPFIVYSHLSLVQHSIFTVKLWFSQAMNYIVLSFLYAQFVKLNDEFSKCIGNRGEFSGNFEQFRRRHQAISRSVQEADRFFMIINVAYFCCQIALIIFVLYSMIFHRRDTLSLTIDSSTWFSLWLLTGVFGLSLTAGLSIVVNLMVRT